MKRKIAILIAAVFLLTFAVSGCTPKNELFGDDYITYYNQNREMVIDEYVGERVNTSDDDLLDIDLSYELISGNTYYVYIDNYNPEYFFNGVVTLTSDAETWEINVRMIAPDFYEFFEADLAQDPADYTFVVEGSFYKKSDAWNIGIDFEEYTSDDYFGMSFIVMDVQEVTLDMTYTMADLFYGYDTMWNYDGATDYFLYDANYIDEYDYTYEIYVDTLNQEVTVYDNQGNTIEVLTY